MAANPFSELGTRAVRRRRVIGHIVREHARGKRVSDVLSDSYVRRLTTPAERRTMLEEPALVQALARAYRTAQREDGASA